MFDCLEWAEGPVAAAAKAEATKKAEEEEARKMEVEEAKASSSLTDALKADSKDASSRRKSPRLGIAAAKPHHQGGKSESEPFAETVAEAKKKAEDEAKAVAEVDAKKKAEEEEARKIEEATAVVAADAKKKAKAEKTLKRWLVEVMMWKRKQKTSALIFERFLILYVRKAEEEANAAGEALDLLDIVDPLNVVQASS